jgi:hypothetical protein
MNNKERFVRLTAVLTATAMISSISLVGCDNIHATDPTTTPSISGEVTPGITPTENPTVTPTKAPTLRPTIEATPTPSTTSTTKPTTEATTTPTTKPTTEATTPTTRPTTEATTTPTTRPTTEAPTPTPTSSELEGVLAERLQFTKDLLYFYDKTIQDSNTAFDAIDKYITRQQIINYGKGGEYLVKTGDVVKFKDGNPAIGLINCKDSVITSFKKAIKMMESYDANYLKEITSNGTKAFMINQISGGNDRFTFNKYGGIALNPTDFTLSRSDISGFLNWSVFVESFGIKMYQLGGDYENYVGYMKESLASDCWWNLYCKNNQTYCKEMSYGDYIALKYVYGEYYNISFKDQKIQDLLNNIRTQNLVKSFGGTWAEITQNIPSRPDWNLGDIK